MKVIHYNLKTVDNAAKFFNEQIAENKDERYIMFIYDDIYEKAKDINEVARKYEELLVRLDVPYAFFPYYLHFNKILPAHVGKPSPRMSVTLQDKFVFDVVQEPAFGMLVVDSQKLRSMNFTFNEKYKICFYIQDLIATCHKNNTYFSNTFFVDVHDSYDLFKDNFSNGESIQSKIFLEEKNEFFKEHAEDKHESINDYLANLKNRYVAIPVIEASSNLTAGPSIVVDTIKGDAKQ